LPSNPQPLLRDLLPNEEDEGLGELTESKRT